MLTAIAPDVVGLPVRSPTLPPATHTNVWILGRKQLVVIDPASPHDDEHARLLEVLHARGRVSLILLTHHHHDHVLGASTLADATGAPILAHPQTAARLPDLPIQPLLDDHIDGDSGRIRVLHTPGHAPGHLALLCPGGEAIVGDLVAGIGTILIDPDDGGNLSSYLDSLKKLRRLRPTVLLPAHGPALRDADGTLRHYLQHRAQRTAQICAALAAGPATPAQLVPAVYPELPPAFHPLAATQILAHLLHLEALGRTRPQQDRWVLLRTGQGHR